MTNVSEFPSLNFLQKEQSEKSTSSLGDADVHVDSKKNPLLMGVDPGDKHTGWCLYDLVDRHYTRFGISGIREFYEVLLHNPAALYVVEDYRVRLGNDPSYRGFSHAWSRVPTAKLIGSIEYVAFLNGASVVLQSSKEKPLGYTLLGKKYVKDKKDMHHMDAMAHVAVYFHKRGGFKLSDQRH